MNERNKTFGFFGSWIGGPYFVYYGVMFFFALSVVQLLNHYGIPPDNAEKGVAHIVAFLVWFVTLIIGFLVVNADWFTWWTPDELGLPDYGSEGTKWMNLLYILGGGAALLVTAVSRLNTGQWPW